MTADLKALLAGVDRPGALHCAHCGKGLSLAVAEYADGTGFVCPTCFLRHHQRLRWAALRARTALRVREEGLPASLVRALFAEAFGRAKRHQDWAAAVALAALLEQGAPAAERARWGAAVGHARRRLTRATADRLSAGGLDDFVDAGEVAE